MMAALIASMEETPAPKVTLSSFAKAIEALESVIDAAVVIIFLDRNEMKKRDGAVPLLAKGLRR